MTSPENPWTPEEYPRYPRYPAEPQGPVVRPPVPAQVDLSFKLWMASVVLGLVGTVIVFLVLDDVIAAAADEAGVSFETAKDLARPLVMTGLVVGLAIIVLLGVLAVQMRRGKNWARITLSVVGGIGVVLALVNIGDEFAVDGIGPVTGTIGVIRMLLTVGAIVLMYGKDSSPYFQPPRPY